jgi:hypothetical protein
MTHTVVYYKVVRDNTGIHEEIPVILTEFGPLQPLIQYILKHRHMLSESNTIKLVQAVGLLIDYMEANHQVFDNPNDLFNTFVQRLYSGTVGVDGNDPSGLYWDARTPRSCACWSITSPSSATGWRRSKAPSNSTRGVRPRAPKSNWRGQRGSTRRIAPSSATP